MKQGYRLVLFLTVLLLGGVGQAFAQADGGRGGKAALEHAPGETPQRFGLEQNYPNPFNPTTSIRFSVARTSNVSLKVYNLLGKEVATLVNSELAAGTYTVSFDGANLSSGYYIYRLVAGSQVLTRKMTLLK